MEESKIYFSLDQIITTIQCSPKDKIGDICQKYATKIGINMNLLGFFYGGNELNLELTFKDHANQIDKAKNEMKILVYKKEIDSIICPNCGEKMKLNIEKVDEIISSYNDINDSINGIKLMIENIIKISTINDINNQLKQINDLLNYINQDLIKNNEKLKYFLHDANNLRYDGYLFDCTNKANLSVNINQGANVAEFEIFLKNNGSKVWDKNTKLILDKSSDCNSDEVILSPQKPYEEKGYKIIFKNLSQLPFGEYKTIFSFWSGGKIYGKNIIILIKIIEYMDKIKEFREQFDISEDSISDENLLEVLKKCSFNYDDTFMSIFG